MTRLVIPFAVALVSAAAAAQEPRREWTLEAVTKVLDDERLDVAAMESWIAGGDAHVRVLIAAYAQPAGDPTVRQRRRDRVLRTLRAIGPRATSAGPLLVQQIAGAERQHVAPLLRTLAETAALGPLEDGDAEGVHDAFAHFIKPGDGDFIDRLREGIRLHVRMTRPLPAGDIDELITALEDADPYRRELAAHWLGRAGARAREALDDLEIAADPATEHPRMARLPNHSLSTDFGPVVRHAAMIAIARIAPDSPQAVPGLRELLHADDPRERVQAAMALGRSGSASAESPLRQALEDEDPRLVAEAVTALGMLDTISGRTIRALRPLAEHENPGIAARARATLKRAGVVLEKRDR